MVVLGKNDNSASFGCTKVDIGKYGLSLLKPA